MFVKDLACRSLPRSLAHGLHRTSHVAVRQPGRPSLHRQQVSSHISLSSQRQLLQQPRQHVRCYAKKEDPKWFELSQEAKETWHRRIDEVAHLDHVKPTLPLIDYNNCLGIDTRWLTTPRPGSKGKAASANCLPEYIAARKRDPEAIICMRVGDFYELLGFDAVLGIAHMGLNPMSLNKGVVRAGRKELSMFRDSLVIRAGYPMAVYEEIDTDGYTYGVAQRGPKTRVRAGLLTPADPNYYWQGLDRERDYRFESPPPFVGVSWSSTGLMLMELNLDEHQLTVTNGLTEETAWGRISSTSIIPPLLLHKPSCTSQDPRVGTMPVQREWEMRLKARVNQSAVGVVKTFDAPDPVKGFIQQVLKEAGREQQHAAGINVLQYDGWLADTPRPLYESTSVQLGLNVNPIMPSLLEAVLPSKLNSEVREPWRGLLLSPPPARVAEGIRMAMLTMSGLRGPHPLWVADLPPVKMLRLLSNQACTDDHFRQFQALLAASIETLGSSKAELRQLSLQLWPLVNHWVKHQLYPDVIRDKWREAEAAIVAVVPDSAARAAWRERPGALEDVYEDEVADGSSRGVPMGESDEEGLSSSAVAVEATSSSTISSSSGSGGENKGTGKRRRTVNFGEVDSTGRRVVPSGAKFDRLFADYRQRMEGRLCMDPLNEYRVLMEGKFRGRVLESLMQEQVDKVQLGWDELRSILQDLWQEGLKEFILAGEPHVKYLPQLVVDEANSSCWLSVLHYEDPDHGYGKVRLAKRLQAATPQDRRGMSIDQKGADRHKFSTSALNQALDRYREAVYNANKAAKQHLQQLAILLLEKFSIPLSAAARFNQALVGAEAHVEHCGMQKGWEVPLVGPPPQRSAKEGGNSRSSSTSSSGGMSEVERPERVHIKVEGMYPYWMDNADASTVRNDIELSSMMVLTGPNMAGKSTVLRSLAAVCLLGICGLLVPAASVDMSWLDAVMLRNFSGDSPAEGRSAFAAEMYEMSFALLDVRPRSLVLVDELGKGTEVHAGTALAGSMLEQLAGSGCAGVFATHLHMLLPGRLQLEAPGLVFAKMGVQEQQYIGRDGEVRTRLVPTWSLSEGSCTQSLAMEVALQQGVSEQVVARAQQLLQQLWEGEGPSGAPPPAAALSVKEGGHRSSSRSVGVAARRDEEHWAKGLHLMTELLQERRQLTAGEAGGQTCESSPGNASDSMLPTVAGSNVGSASSRSRRNWVPPAAAYYQLHELQSQLHTPPPSHNRRPSFYMVMWDRDGLMYGGSTKGLKKRLTEHMRVSRGKEFGVLRMAYALVPGSEAAELEMQLVRRLEAAGLPMWSTYDGKKRSRA